MHLRILSLAIALALSACDATTPPVPTTDAAPPAAASARDTQAIGAELDAL